jgi:ATP-binding cassette subfamily B protein
MELKRFTPYYRPYKRLFLFDLFCASLVAGLDLLFPIFSKRFVDDFIPNKQINMIIIFTFILFVLYFLRMGATYFMGYWGHVMGTAIEKDIRSDLFQHIQQLPYRYFDDTKTGIILSRFTNDLREIGEMAHHGPEDLFISAFMIIGSFIFLVIINLLLTLILFAFVLVLVIFVALQRRNSAHSFREVKKSHGEINSRLETSILGIRLCKSFTNEAYETIQFEERNTAYANSWNSAYRSLAIMTSGNNFLTDILGVVVIGLGGYLVIIGEMSLGSLVAYLLYSTLFVVPIRRLIQFMHQYLDGSTGFDRFCELMDIKPEIQDVPDAKTMVDPQGQIEFRNVSYKYEPNLPYILKDFNLDIPEGTIVGLVGSTGVGKTTLTHLIPRFYEPDEGEIMIDGMNISKFTQKSLRKNIGFVQQDVVIFWGTIKENILYGKPDATDNEIIEAAKKAKIHDFIVSLPNGYDSVVGERGIKLSGGEKQRIAIARIFLKNPPILILDEATSSLDNVTELAIQESLMDLAKGRTTIIIAHRLSTVRSADQILILTKEGIKERGSHEELIAQNGIYEQLYNSQLNNHNNHKKS